MSRNFALFNYGFRPFFLGAGVYGTLLVPLWLYILSHGNPENAPLIGVQWHMHEMIFGFMGAAMAGFILTASPNWTGERGYSGNKLFLLFAVWLVARVLVFPLWSCPMTIAAIADLSFIPLLLSFVIPSLIRVRNTHSMIISTMLGLFWISDVLCWLDRLAMTDTWDKGISLAFDVILMMVVAIGGRIIPSFTINYLRRLGQTPSISVGGRLDHIALLLTAMLIIAHQFLPKAIIAVVALTAGAVHFLRLIRWQGYKTWQDPLVWILHFAYLWVPIALMIEGFRCAGIDTITTAVYRHALGVGAFSCMIIAVMSRASLGHTGRLLKAAQPMVAGYISLILSAIIRSLITPFIDQDYYMMALQISGGLWTLSFLVFSFIYAPILIMPRADGKPG